MMSMTDLVTVSWETPKIDIGYSLEKEFTKLIHMNPCMLLHLTINYVDSCLGYLCGPLS